MTNYHLQHFMNHYAYGVVDMSLELPLLERNLIKVNNIECIMQDYSLISYPSFGSKVLEFVLKQDPGHRTINSDVQANVMYYDLFVYLCLAKEYSIGKRFIPAEMREVHDMNDPNNLTNIIVLDSDLYLSCEKMESHMCMPIAKYRFEGGICKILQYDPPTPSFKCAKLSYAMIFSLIHNIRSIVQDIFFDNKIRDNVAKNLQIYVKALVKLEQCLTLEVAHPIDIHNELLILCLDLCENSSDYAACIDFKYNHDDIYAVFSQMATYVNAKINADRKIYFISTHKFIFDDGKFMVSIPDDCNSSTLTLKLLFQKKTNPDIWIKNAVISDTLHLVGHHIKRSCGLDRKIISVDSQDMHYDIVRMQITLDIYMRDIILLNNLDSKDSPNEIYLIDDWKK